MSLALRSVRVVLAAALWVVTGAASVSASSELGSHTDSLLPAPVVEATKAAVAERWAILPERVSISWGPLPRGVEIAPEASVELLGTGTSGWWIASITNPADPTGPTPRALRTRIRAGSIQPAALATRDLTRGSTLRDGDLRIGETVVWGEPQPVLLARPGWTIRSAVAEGTALRPPLVDAPPVVRSGESVEAHVSRGRIALSIEGTALGTAGPGERVRVRTNTGRILTGTAIGPGRVVVTSSDR